MNKTKINKSNSNRKICRFGIGKQISSISLELSIKILNHIDDFGYLHKTPLFERNVNYSKLDKNRRQKIDGWLQKVIMRNVTLPNSYILPTDISVKIFDNNDTINRVYDLIIKPLSSQPYINLLIGENILPPSKRLILCIKNFKYDDEEVAEIALSSTIADVYSIVYGGEYGTRWCFSCC